jgi:predicted glutamine amidotransferase
MCGLYGCVANYMLTAEIENVIDLAAINVRRGKDSTGLAIAHGGKKRVEYLKGTMNPVSFYDHENVKKLISERPIHAMMGHNRFATIGHINQTNAHPFRYGKIVGMHNGTIKALEPPKKDQDKITDSRLLIEHLAKHGLQSAIDAAGIDGAMALTWIDEEQNTLNFYRNIHRPLSFMLSSGDSTMYWSSEVAALRLLDSRSALVYKTPESFKMEHHYIIELGINKVNMTVIPMQSPVKPVKYKPMTAQEVIKAVEDKKKEKHPFGGMYPQSTDLTGPPTPDTVTTGPQTSTAGEKPTSIHLPQLPHQKKKHHGKESVPLLDTRPIPAGSYYTGYGNNMWSISETVKKLVGTTCDLCTKKCTIFEPVYWTGPDNYVCHEHMAQVKELTNDVHKGVIKRGH